MDFVKPVYLNSMKPLHLKFHKSSPLASINNHVPSQFHSSLVRQCKGIRHDPFNSVSLLFINSATYTSSQSRSFTNIYLQNKQIRAKSVLSTLSSAAAIAKVLGSILTDFVRYEIRRSLFSNLVSVFTSRLTSDFVMIIEEFDGLETNHIFEAVELYLGALTKTAFSSSSLTRLKVQKSEDNTEININLDRNHGMVDKFKGIEFEWLLHCHNVEFNNDFYNPRDRNSTMRSEVRSFRLTFHNKFKHVALEKYLPHIIKEAELIKQQTRAIRLYTLESGSGWTSIHLNHPATFETLAMEQGIKEMIIEDLERFVSRKEYYRRVGKAWKRGYLLYGPPGTGKSSLIAAMANYLNFDIFDLELSGMSSDTALRMALVDTDNKSIVVVEDVDCCVDFHDRDKKNNATNKQKKKVTLSGLLNFIDGLWSSCGDERIIIFTTNHKDKLDPALLRPGRMDLHIHMSYCTHCGFRTLAYNYLGIEHHRLFADVERLIVQAQVTPAEIAEQLMRHNDPEPALTGLVNFLKMKKAGKSNN